MNNGAPLHLRNGSTASNGRVSGDHRHMSTGSLNMPNGPQNGTPRFDGPRSPPGKQSMKHPSASRKYVLTLYRVDTSHVPCKFFKQGTCQAGAACPFSHDLNTTQDTICKYFSKVSLNALCKLCNHNLTTPRETASSEPGVPTFMCYQMDCASTIRRTGLQLIPTLMRR